jgi:hypothetical protein
MSKGSSERELLRVERELKQASPGDQRAVGGGIYMRLDRSHSRRFVLPRPPSRPLPRRHLRHLGGGLRRQRQPRANHGER